MGGWCVLLSERGCVDGLCGLQEFVRLSDKRQGIFACRNLVIYMEGYCGRAGYVGMYPALVYCKNKANLRRRFIGLYLYLNHVIVYDNMMMEGVITIYTLEFYRKENGQVPVQDFLYSLNPKLRAKAFSDIELLKKLGSELKEPYVKPLKGRNNKGLYELRIKFSSDIARIFYFTYYDNKFVLLHGFIKKSMKTPANEIDRARRYMEDYKRRADHE